MSYAETRSKLANLLIKAGYNVTKSLRAVRYPYIESMQLGYNKDTSLFINHKLYENSSKKYISVDADSGFVHIADKDYGILGEKNKAKAFVEVTQQRINFVNSLNVSTTPWASVPLRLTVKYKNKYPKDEIIDSYKTIGRRKSGRTSVAGFFGHQEGEIPLPRGGWLEVELPSDQ